MPAPKSSFLDKVLGRIGRLDAEGLQTVVQRLAREHSFLETLFNTIEDGVLVVDEQGHVIYFNQAVTRLIGLQPSVEGQHITTLLPEVDWEKILSKAKLFHVSGITPALSPSAAETTALAMKAAKEAGCLVSYDLNYRKKLWSPSEAKKCQEPLMNLVDIITTTEEDTGVVFGIREASYQKVAETLARSFGFKAVAITLREDLSVWKNNWTAIAYADGKIYSDRTYTVEIVDRVGAGDSFTAGFIYGYLTGGAEKGVKYGNALSALKHTMPGDFNWSTLEEVEAQIKGAGLRISR